MCAGPNGDEKPWHEKDFELFMAFSANYASVSRCAGTIACNDNLVLSHNIDDGIRATVSDIPAAPHKDPRFIIHIWRRCKRSVLLC